MWAVLMMVAGAATLVGAPLTAPDAPMTPTVMATAAILGLCGLVAWFVPWTRVGARFAVTLPAICIVDVEAAKKPIITHLNQLAAIAVPRFLG